LFKQAVDITDDLSEAKLKELIASLGGRVTPVPKSAGADTKAAQRSTMLAKAIDLLRERFKNNFKDIVAYLDKGKKPKAPGAVSAWDTFSY
jgi:hypothetical protein